MDQELGVHFNKAFSDMTSDHADPNFPCILHHDCHNSHVTLEFLLYAKEHNIIVMGYVPHTTHLCQGLDVVLFSPHKCAFAEEHEKHEQETGRTLECAEFVVVNHWAVMRVFTQSNILAAFCKTGIRPFDPTVITEKMLAPSLPTSLQTTQVFPIVQPSPVRKVIDTIWGSQVLQSASAPPHVSHPLSPSPPLTPSPYYFPDAASESVAFALEHELIATSALSSQTPAPSLLGALQSSSVSFLITPSNTTADHTLPPLPSGPDLSRQLRSFFKSAQPPSPETWRNVLPSIQTVCELEEASVARMVLQDRYCSNLRLQLHNQKKQREKSEWEKALQAPEGRILTGDLFLQACERDQEVKEKKVRETQAKREKRLATKEDCILYTAWRSAQTASRKEQRALDLKHWNEEVEAAREAGLNHKIPVPRMVPRVETPEKWRRFSQKVKKDVENENEGKAAYTHSRA